MHNFTASGFPSPAEDYAKPKLDLNTHLIAHPAATFFMRSGTDEMKAYGIHLNDLLIVDRAESLTKTSIVTAVLDGEIILTPYHRLHTKTAEIWGRVTAVIHRL